MRGQERKTTGPERNTCDHVIKFSTHDVPERDRKAMMQDFLGRTLSGCNVRPVVATSMSVEVQVLPGRDVILSRATNRNLNNFRDEECIRDGDDYFVFVTLVEGEGRVDHRDHRAVLKPGQAVVLDFARTASVEWNFARVRILRIARASVHGSTIERCAGLPIAADRAMLRLTSGSAEATWQAATTGAGVPEIAERHIVELVTATAAARLAHEVPSGPALSAARVAAMNEIIARHYANPCLTMRDVAAAVGLSERSGHLAFAREGLAFTAQLFGVRLDRAREILTTSSAAVIDTAFAVGFSDASHFHRLFKQRFGHTPGETREALLS